MIYSSTLQLVVIWSPRSLLKVAMNFMWPSPRTLSAFISNWPLTWPLRSPPLPRPFLQSSWLFDAPFWSLWTLTFLRTHKPPVYPRILSQPQVSVARCTRCVGESHRYHCSLSGTMIDTKFYLSLWPHTRSSVSHVPCESQTQRGQNLSSPSSSDHQSSPQPHNVLWLFCFFLTCWHYNPVAQTRDFGGHVSLLIYPNFPCLGNRWDLTLKALQYFFKSMSLALSLILVSS